MAAPRPFRFDLLEKRLTAQLEPKLQGTVAFLSTTERPLQGWAGYLDWRAHGAISDFLKREWIGQTSAQFALVSTPLSPWKNPIWVLLVSGEFDRGIPLNAELAEKLKGMPVHWGIPASEVEKTSEKQIKHWVKAHQLESQVEFFSA